MKVLRKLVVINLTGGDVYNCDSETGTMFLLDLPILHVFKINLTGDDVQNGDSVTGGIFLLVLGFRALF